jgi:hypothetical protein
MTFLNNAYCCKYTRIAFPFLGFFSGGLIHVVIYDLYNHYNNIQIKTMTLKRLHNFSAYLGLTIGLSVLYRGKPLLMR